MGRSVKKPCRFSATTVVGVRRGRIMGKWGGGEGGVAGGGGGGFRLWLYVGVIYTVVGSKGRLSRRTSTASGCLPSPSP